MKPKYQFLTAVEFNRAVKHLKASQSRISEKNLGLVRKALVEKIPVPELSQSNNCTPQLINRNINKVCLAFKDSLGLPEGWQSIRVELPNDEAEKVINLEKQLKAKLR